ncbi:MAG: tetratricopeptide repeat protein [Candidatus Omnitrophica bacterium]|nr:tetratricopeptide repeat protein [Candidatus Omnitrophota bacterium]MCB9721992.1 tetratricopeptide repeat protein [Candidatus Omnitrophota bacterium]
MFEIIREHKWLLLALFGLVVLNHYPAAGHGYMIDDFLFLEGRWAAGYHGYLDFLTRTEAQHFAPLYFAVNYFLFEIFRAAPVLLSLVNILLFYLSVAFFFILTLSWTRTLPLAALTAVLMAVYPAHVFPVGYKTASFVFICAILQLLALWFLWRCSRTAEPKSADITAGLVCCALALLSYEWAVLLPLYGVLLLRVCGDLSWRESLRRTAPYAVLAVMFVAVYWMIAGSDTGLSDRFARMGFSLPAYVAVLLFFMAGHISLFIVPRAFPFMMTIPRMDGQIWLWAGILGLLLAAAGGLYRRGIFSRPGVFGAGWYLIGWLPVVVAMLGHPSAGLVFEPHWLFFASYGLTLLIAQCLLWLGARMPVRAAAVLICAVTVCLMAVSRPQHRVMETEKAYCEFWLQFSPPNPIALSRLGQIHFREGNDELALKYFNRLAAASDGQHFRELNNIGLIYHRQGKLAEAEHYLREAVTINPAFAPAWNNLGQVARESGRPSVALEYFLRAVELDGHLPAARLNLVEMLLIARHPAEAVSVLSAMDMRGVSSYYRQEAAIMFVVAAETLRDQNLIAQALANARAMLDGADLDLRLAQRLLNTGQGKKAEQILRESIQKESGTAASYLMLGSYLGNAERFDDAIAVWQQGKQRFPAETQFDRFIREARNLQSSAP